MHADIGNRDALASGSCLIGSILELGTQLETSYEYNTMYIEQVTLKKTYYQDSSFWH